MLKNVHVVFTEVHIPTLIFVVKFTESTVSNPTVHKIESEQMKMKKKE